MIFLIFWTMGNILVNVKKHGFNLEEELWIGLWVGYVTELLDTPWSGCFATSTAFFKTTNWLKIIKNLCNVIDSAYYSYFDWGALLYYRCWGWLDHFCYGNGTLLGAVVGTQRTKRLEHTLSPMCLGNFVNCCHIHYGLPTDCQSLGEYFWKCSWFTWDLNSCRSDV